MSDPPDYDIAIVGAGVVGLCVCALLENQGYRIALIDPLLQPPALPDPYDLRTYAITPASMRLLDKLGVYAAMDHSRVAEFFGMEVWDAASNGAIQFSAAALGRERLGHIVEHSNLMIGLHKTLVNRRKLTRLVGSVKALEQGDLDVGVVLDNGEKLRAALVLACDGANSPMRLLLGLSAKTRDYTQHAIVCNVEVEVRHANVARQRFLTTGPLAFLPLPKPRECAIVWSTTAEQATWAATASDQEFQAVLGVAFDHALGEVRSASERLAVPLQSLHTSHYAVGRTVLLGDAAHVVHPLAGQGLNLGLMDAAALAEVLAERDELSLRFPGSSLRRYERMRRGENSAMLKVTDQLNRLFGDEHELARRVRGTGMAAVNRIVPLKHWLMLRAMGDVGDVPTVAALR
jgi:2-octaprenylphenol hydroxylase